DGDQEPARVFFAGLGAVVLAVRVTRGVVRVALAHAAGDADHARGLGVAVVEEDLVADLHLVAHEVARLVIPNAVPVGAAVAREVVDRVDAGLRLHEPVTLRHRSIRALVRAGRPARRAPGAGRGYVSVNGYGPGRRSP